MTSETKARVKHAAKETVAGAVVVEVDETLRLTVKGGVHYEELDRLAWLFSTHKIFLKPVDRERVFITVSDWTFMEEPRG